MSANLVRSGPPDDYVLYEDGDSWCYACHPLAEIVLTTKAIRIRQGDREWETSPGDAPMEQVAALLDGLPGHGWRAYGWAAFELAYLLAGQDLDALPPDEPLLRLIVPGTEVVLREGLAVLRGTDAEVLAGLREQLNRPVGRTIAAPRPLPVEDLDRDGYRNAVGTAVEAIRQRRLQKMILSRVVPVDFPVDLVDTYVVGRRGNSPARSFLLHTGGVAAAGFSPETVVEIDADGWVHTQPLAGTRATGQDERDTERLRTDLLWDTKELSEHAMSVKVAYDEMAALARSGTAAVADFLSIKVRGSVQHLASSVRGQLPVGTSAWDAFGALFPAVTACGVPKPAAYQAIRSLESHPRGLYAGAVLRAEQGGALDAALVLRTVFRQGGSTWLRAGAGIVADSDPDREFTETCEKLRSIASFLVPGNADDTTTF
ncbi:salicylate synthase [Longimycelium tulufanense]|uniref:salicylate synthase n=1 Tax=Longimycelium tulufanense TaxID=907463 RepID=UPI001E3A8C5E|nr:salicylate synthase [Longimycelium tulufanense]